MSSTYADLTTDEQMVTDAQPASVAAVDDMVLSIEENIGAVVDTGPAYPVQRPAASRGCLFASDGCHPEALRGGIYSITGSAEPVSTESFEGGERDTVDGELTDGMACSNDISPQSYYDTDPPNAPGSSSSSWAADTAAGRLDEPHFGGRREPR